HATKAIKQAVTFVEIFTDGNRCKCRPEGEIADNYRHERCGNEQSRAEAIFETIIDDIRQHTDCGDQHNIQKKTRSQNSTAIAKKNDCEPADQLQAFIHMISGLSLRRDWQSSWPQKPDVRFCA